MDDVVDDTAPEDAAFVVALAGALLEL